jgi:hypothetical protein
MSSFIGSREISSYNKERLRIGDRVTWSHGGDHNDSEKTGEVVRIDVVRGRVVQLVVFTDYWQWEPVRGRDLALVKKVTEPRFGIENKNKFREGDVVSESINGPEFVVAKVLPNNFVLPEPTDEYPDKIPIPRWTEYLHPTTKKRRKKFKRWPEDESNPWICRVPIPFVKGSAPNRPAPFDFTESVKKHEERQKKNGKVRRRRRVNPVEQMYAARKEQDKRPRRTPVTRTPVTNDKPKRTRVRRKT